MGKIRITVPERFTVVHDGGEGHVFVVMFLINLVAMTSECEAFLVVSAIED